MPTPKQLTPEEMKERSKWATADPVSLVSQARQTLYSGGSNIPRNEKHVLEEIIGRFEQQCKAAAGASTLVPTGQEF